MLCLVVVCAAYSPLLAYEPGKFPGKGSKQAWISSILPYNQGNSFADKKDWDMAIKKYQESIAVYPYCDGHFLNLGIAYEKRSKPGDLQKSEVAYRKATELCPTDWRNWNALAAVLASLEKYEGSRAAGLKALQCNPPAKDAAEIRTCLSQLDQFMASRK